MDEPANGDAYALNPMVPDVSRVARIATRSRALSPIQARRGYPVSFTIARQADVEALTAYLAGIGAGP